MRRRLELARRGHKLLKNKQEKLMQNFFLLVRENHRAPRGEVERGFLEIGERYLEGRASTGSQALEDALELSTRKGSARFHRAPRYEHHEPGVHLRSAR